jgi:curved DNA-binding protein CbpA
LLSFTGFEQMAANLYAVLGVTADATAVQLRAAYLDAARAAHPDKRKDSAASIDFTALQSAWDVLGDPERRAAYDKELRSLEAARPQTVAVSEDVHEDEMDLVAVASCGSETLKYACRCGDAFVITVAQLHHHLGSGGVLVQCSSCSLFIRVHPTPGTDSGDSGGESGP